MKDFHTPYAGEKISKTFPPKSNMHFCDPSNPFPHGQVVSALLCTIRFLDVLRSGWNHQRKHIS